VRAIPHRRTWSRAPRASWSHAIVGDKIYGANEQLYLRFIETGWTDELADQLLLPRHALHSARLRINDQFDWQSPLPEDLANWTPFETTTDEPTLSS
jgi:23S rRNA pseudouridine1911/1915/1917 synthase